MRILLTGGGGQVAQALLTQARGEDIEIVAMPRLDLDITSAHAIETCLQRYVPDVVINTAAYTAVDAAEDDAEAAMRVNAYGPELLAKACAARDIFLVHLSTDYVFDGTKGRPYVESDFPHPLNVYGDTKYRGEVAVQNHAHRYVIVRLSGVFSATGSNFVKTMVSLARAREELRVVSDQVTCPTGADDIARALLLLSRRSDDVSDGIYHYCASSVFSWYEFACLILEVARRYMPLRARRVVPLTSDEFASKAVRPRYSVLDCQKIARDFGIAPRAAYTSLDHVLRSLSKL